MAQLDNLPTDLLLMIIEYLECAKDVSALTHSARPSRAGGWTNGLLYSHFAPVYSPRGIMRIIEHDNGAAMRKLPLINPDLD